MAQIRSDIEKARAFFSNTRIEELPLVLP